MHVSRSLAQTLAAVALFLAACAAAQTQPQSLPTSALEIASGSQRHRFTVEVAQKSEERSVGLMFRTQMAADRGMLFAYEQEQPVSMWMKNTFIPLDMLFIRADGRVANIAEWTTPRSLDEVPSKGPVKAVLELNGGTAARLGLKAGDVVRHPVFGNGN
jgi:uncharacterized membrane protein (UPF0127 family)